MALMFTASQASSSGQASSARRCKVLRDRILRLGVPFAVAAGILMPLAYYPSYAGNWRRSGLPRLLQRVAIAWLFGPAAPAWFIGCYSSSTPSQPGFMNSAPLEGEYAGPAANLGADAVRRPISLAGACSSSFQHWL